MSEFLIRRLDAADLPEYSALFQQGLMQHTDCFRISPADPQEDPPVGQSPEQFTLGAFSGAGRLVGIVSFARDTREKMRHKGLLYRMYVTDRAAGQSIGRRLLREALALARVLPGLEAITLTVVASNMAARHLYASEGFRSFALEPRALRIGETYYDEEQMRLDLLGR